MFNQTLSSISQILKSIWNDKVNGWEEDHEDSVVQQPLWPQLYRKPLGGYYRDNWFSAQEIDVSSEYERNSGEGLIKANVVNIFHITPNI